MRLIACDSCRRIARWHPPGTAHRRRLSRYQRHSLASAGGEWQVVSKTLEGGARIELDACCEGCAADLRETRYRVVE